MVLDYHSQQVIKVCDHSKSTPIIVSKLPQGETRETNKINRLIEIFVLSTYSFPSIGKALNLYNKKRDC